LRRRIPEAKCLLGDPYPIELYAMSVLKMSKLTLKDVPPVPPILPDIDSNVIRETREKMNCSRAVFARKLHINLRTLERWEQGRSKPNSQAAALVLLVRAFPDIVQRLELAVLQRVSDSRPN
jgi:putative transcriptional regulator